MSTIFHTFENSHNSYINEEGGRKLDYNIVKHIMLLNCKIGHLVVVKSCYIFSLRLLG